MKLDLAAYIKSLNQQTTSTGEAENAPRSDDLQEGYTTIPYGQRSSPDGAASPLRETIIVPIVCDYHDREPEDEYVMEDPNCSICDRNRKGFRTRRMLANFANMQVGKRFAKYKWADYVEVNEDAAKNKRILKRYADEFSTALKRGTSGILIGNHGTGKNLLCALVCKTLAANSYSALHTTVQRLVRRVRQAWRTGSQETESDVINSFVKPDLLVIDEVGVQQGSTNEINIITEIINDRYEEVRPTILISNLTFEQLEATLGPRIIDRFYEGGSFLLEFNWESYRRKKD